MEKKSPTDARREPIITGSAAMSTAESPAVRSGVRPSISIRSVSGPRSESRMASGIGHDLAQVEVIGPELAAVVASADRFHAGPARGVDPGAHRAADRGRV